MSLAHVHPYCPPMLPPSMPSCHHTMLLHAPCVQLVEVVMDLGRPPLARFPGIEVPLAPEAVTAEDLAQAVAQVGVGYGGG